MVKQYEIYWAVLDPTLGSEINKTRPCVIISPDVSNNHLNTVIIAPATSAIKTFPMRMDIVLESKKGQLALDQIRCIDKVRLKRKIGTLSPNEVIKIKQLLKEYFVD